MSTALSLYEMLVEEIKTLRQAHEIPQEPHLQPTSCSDSCFQDAQRYVTISPNVAVTTLHETVMNAVKSGKDVSKYLEALEQICDRRINAKAGQQKKIYFPLCAGVAITGLEPCLGVITRSGKDGTASHLTLKADLPAALQWIKTYAPLDSEVFIAGGWKPNSEIYRNDLRAGLSDIGYTEICADLMAEPGKGCNFFMDRSGRVEVHHYKSVRRPEGMNQMDCGFTRLKT